jgi:hypothetical protein
MGLVREFHTDEYEPLYSTLLAADAGRAVVHWLRLDRVLPRGSCWEDEHHLQPLLSWPLT